MNKHIEELLLTKYNYKVKNYTFIGEGWMSKTYLLNDDTILRVPKSDYASEDLYKESMLLPIVNEVLTIETPKFEIFDKQENGKWFVTYKAINGKFHDKESFFNLDDARINVFMNDLADIMDQLNSIEVINELKDEFTTDIKQEYIDEYKVYKSRVFNLLDQLTLKNVNKIYEDYISDENNFKYEPKLIHADISFDHLVFNPESDKLKGLIDFGDLTFSDPAFEYMYILDGFGLRFMKELMNKRNISDQERTISKVKFFLLIDNISIIDEGVKKDNQELIEEGIELVRTTLDTFY